MHSRITSPFCLRSVSHWNTWLNRTPAKWARKCAQKVRKQSHSKASLTTASRKFKDMSKSCLNRSGSSANLRVLIGLAPIGNQMCWLVRETRQLSRQFRSVFDISTRNPKIRKHRNVMFSLCKNNLQLKQMAVSFVCGLTHLTYDLFTASCYEFLEDFM